MRSIIEDEVETIALDILQAQGWHYRHGTDLEEERPKLEAVVLEERLRQAVQRLNPALPAQCQDDAVRAVLRLTGPDLLSVNEDFHRLLTEGVPVTYSRGGEERHDFCALIDVANPANNEFLAVNQFTVVQGNQNKRPDVVLFVNGLPLVVVELKNPADEKATLERAWNQIQTYKEAIPQLFYYNALCVISDGHHARAGSLSAGLSRFAAWKTIDGERDAHKLIPQMEVLLKGMLRPDVLVDLVRNFTVFEKERRQDKLGQIRIETAKKVAAYHQYHAVNKAVRSTLQASAAQGSRKGGVVWHTQGSGKSLSMVFFTGKLVLALDNPTVVVITDRNDLDDQLFDTFAASKSLLRQEPRQAQSRDHLKDLLRVASGGIVFTTIQKFMPDRGLSRYDALSDRRNIVVIADEAHRTQYGFEAKLRDEKDEQGRVVGQSINYGFAKYMRDALPNATFIGFTGTPIENEDVNTKLVFGDYVDTYDIAQAVEDGATVPIYYESRLARVNLDEEGRRLIEQFDKELEENDELSEKEKAKARWSQVEAIVGNPERIRNLAQDIVTHFELREVAMAGKGMIVAMSRRIAAMLYGEIVRIRPEWHSEDLKKGKIKVVMTASSDEGPDMARFRTTKQDRSNLATRMKDPDDELKLVIVRDMWLTGFDAPSLHTMYVDKPMRGHNLMQAIARVNRVFSNKPGGLIVDYLGIASDLKKALSFYSKAGGTGDPAETQARAVELLEEKLEVVRAMFEEQSRNQEDIGAFEPQAYYRNSTVHPPKEGFNYERFFTGTSKERLDIILQAEEHILGLEDGKNRFLRQVALLSQAFALSMPHLRAQQVRDEVAFFQAVRARLAKFDTGGPGGGSRPGGKATNYDEAIRQLVDEALSSESVVDIFDAAGMKKPDISVLSEEFMKEVQGMKHKNLALELLKKLLNDEIKLQQKTNLVKSRQLLEMLEGAIKRYQNNLLTTAEIIQELIVLAKELREGKDRAKTMGLSDDELAFYDALAENKSAKDVMEDAQLRQLAREIAEKVRSNTTIDWSIKESARANIMRVVKRTLNKYGYPPDFQQQAIELVLKQATLMADGIVD